MNVMLLTLTLVTGNVYEEFLQEGNQAYTEERLGDAIQAYERLVESGVASAPLYFNLANTYHYQGDPGRAVLYYEAALRVDPAFTPAFQGLRRTTGVPETDAQLPAGFRPAWPWSVPGCIPVLTGLVLVLWWLFWGILLAVTFAGRFPKWRWMLALMGGLVLAGSVLIAPQIGPAPAVVLSDAELRYGPDTRDAIRQPLRAGRRVCIEQHLGTWALVDAGAGMRGWLELVNLERVPTARYRW